MLSSFLNILFISLSDAFGDGPPLTPVVCASLAPFGHWSFEPDPTEVLDFRITTDKDWFMPNERVTSKFNIVVSCNNNYYLRSI